MFPSFVSCAIESELKNFRTKILFLLSTKTIFVFNHFKLFDIIGFVSSHVNKSFFDS